MSKISNKGNYYSDTNHLIIIIFIITLPVNDFYDEGNVNVKLICLCIFFSIVYHHLIPISL